jgi:hypothetical protein
VLVTTAWRVLRLRLEERPPIRRVAANILNKQSGQPTKGGPPACGLGEVLTSPHRKMYSVTNRLQRKPRTWTDTLVQNLQRKKDVRFISWNVRSLYTAGSLTLTVRKLSRCKLDTVGVQEVRWDK